MSPPLIINDAEADTAVWLFGEAVAAVAADPQQAIAESKGWHSADA
jgi:hypothetical protein